MSDAAGADQQHALLAQAAQGLANPHLQGRAGMTGQGQLHDRNVGIRVHQHERYPGTMVARALLVEFRGQFCIDEQLANLLRQLRLPWRGVLHGIQLGGKAAEVVPGARLRGVTDS